MWDNESIREYLEEKEPDRLERRRKRREIEEEIEPEELPFYEED